MRQWASHTTAATSMNGSGLRMTSSCALGISRRTVARKLERFVGNARKYLLRSEP